MGNTPEPADAADGATICDACVYCLRGWTGDLVCRARRRFSLLTRS